LLRPALGGGGQGERGAVEDVQAALTDDQGVERSERSSLAGQVDDVGGGAFPDPVPVKIEEPLWPKSGPFSKHAKASVRHDPLPGHPDRWIQAKRAGSPRG
jgi:hypothetical protein